MSTKSTTDVFTNDFSREIWADTYKANKDNTIYDSFRRVANAIASVEDVEKQKYWEDKFYDLLLDFKFVPGGRILANAGTEFKGTSLINCFTGGHATYDCDSIDGIMEALRYQVKTLKSEGGYGDNYSFIRPRGAFIKGIGVESPGPIKFMEMFDKSSEIITAGSGEEANNKNAKKKIRKGAQMGIMDCVHPSIEEFITAKQTEGRLTKFNLSVNFSDEYMDRIIEINRLEELEQTEDIKNQITKMDKWDLWFPDTTFEKYKEEWDGNFKLWKEKQYPYNVYKTISVKGLWDLVMNSTYKRAEPGVLFLDVANKTHCWNYAGTRSWISSTNACSEQTMPQFSSCDLGTINLTQFINKTKTGFDIEKIKKSVKIAVRFLDNVNSYTTAPLPQYMDSITNRRRIGLGVMGWGSSLYILKTKFASGKAEKIKEELMHAFTEAGIEESINLAEEKGMFKDCEPEKHAKAYFWDQINLNQELRNKMKKYGIRNSALFSCQPNGNTSILANIITGGIEPLFLHSYIRTSIVNVLPEHIREVCPKYWTGEFIETELFKFVKEGSDTILRGVDSDGTVYKIDKNRGLTKETLCEDYGVSILKNAGEWNENADYAVTTSNLTVEEHLIDLRGWGKWLDASCSKTVNIPKDYKFEDFKNVYLDAYKSKVLKGITTYRAGIMTNVLAATTNGEDTTNSIPKPTAPKRGKRLNADMHHITIKGNRYYVAVGLMDGMLYEVFTGSNHNHEGDIIIPKTVKSGIVVKHGTGKYVFISEDKEYSLTNGHNDPTADALTRMISIGLRHGVEISNIVKQLENTTGDMFTFSKVLSRTLKKYIKDGTVVDGEKCPTCGGNIIRMSGCYTCMDCGYSKCQ